MASRWAGLLQHRAGFLAFVAAGLAASFALAWGSWHACEKRFLRLKDRFAAPRRARRPQK